jgi:hypothetical protein
VTRNKATEPDPPRTLAETHEALARLRPARQAPLTEWLAYYQRSTAWYAEVAEIDRGHHHESLFWAEHERTRAKEIKEQIATQQHSESNEEGEVAGGGENRDTGSPDDVDASP